MLQQQKKNSRWILLEIWVIAGNTKKSKSINSHDRNKKNRKAVRDI